jgi:CRP/FNR family transcriptional regulator
MAQENAAQYLQLFPALAAITDPAWIRVMQMAQLITLPAEAPLFRGGAACENYFLVLEGIVKVRKVSESGHEIILYRIEAGKVCELTTSCLLADADYPADAVAESDARVLLIPKVHFYEAMSGSPGFRKFVFSSLDQGMHELVQLIEEVAFGHMDHRLAHHLLDLAGQQKIVMGTHYDLAVGLGTAREVVSRLLKEFEHRGWVRLHRGRIEIIDQEALRELVKENHM